MTAGIIDGKAIANRLNSNLKKSIEKMQYKPSLAVVLVGEDPASKVYVNMKGVRCQEIGIKSKTVKLPVETLEKELLSIIDGLNKDENVDAILVQLPLPKQINEQHIIEGINPNKDVDGFHPINVARLANGNPDFVPCTPKGILRLLDEEGINPVGKRVVVIGRSIIVGKPTADLLLWRDATVTLCHSKTKDLAARCREADIVVVAVGKPGLITADMIKEGTIVIDVGTTRVSDTTSKKGYRLVGDVDFEQVKKKAGRITPVPGGVGPMTIAMLLENTVLAAKRRQK